MSLQGSFGKYCAGASASTPLLTTVQQVAVVGIQAWSAATTYGIGAVVLGSNSDVYTSLVGSNTNNNPTIDNGTHWTLTAIPPLPPGPPRILRSMVIYNSNASTSYVQVFDALAANVTLGTTAPNLSYPLALSSTVNLLDIDAAFKTGIAIAATTGVNTATTVGTGLVVNAVYD